MQAANRGEGLPVPVNESAHWRILIRPDGFEEERIGTFMECWELVESSRVSLRGWDYPHVSRDQRANGNDWIASWSDFRGHNEYWRLYQSAQFIHLISFREDIYGEESEEIARRSIMSMPDGFQPTGYVEIILAIYQITEIFEFTTRLAMKGIFGEVVHLGIGMMGVMNRVIVVRDPSRSWGKFCHTSEENLQKDWLFETDHLISDSAISVIVSSIM